MLGTIRLGELRSRSAALNDDAPLIVISTDKRLKDLNLRVVQFFPSNFNPETGKLEPCFKIKIEVDDLGSIPGDDEVCHCGMLMNDHHQGSSCTTPRSMGSPP